jgi:predicted ATP-binding protein involved in virulence
VQKPMYNQIIFDKRLIMKKIEKIQIKGLFDQFNYDLELKDDGLTILTGPNGYGKTTILNIIHSISQSNVQFLFEFPFDSITFEFLKSTDKLIIKSYETKTLGTEIKFSFKNKSLIISNLQYKLAAQSILSKGYRKFLGDIWEDEKTGQTVLRDDLLQKEDIKEKILAEISKESKLTFTDITRIFPEIYYIKEQRLLNPLQFIRPEYLRPNTEETHTETKIEKILGYAESLRKILISKDKESNKFRNEQKSTYPERLFEEKSKISEENYKSIINEIILKQKKLSEYGLTTTIKNGSQTYKEEDAKALKVFVEDELKYLSTFDGLLSKLEFFSKILREKKLCRKNIAIHIDFGFKFFTDKGDKLPLNKLSSGEQNQIIMIYSLLFETSPESLVLIDEPEISLHVAWQMDFLKDIIEIINFQKFSVLIATHSPEIINQKWDNVIDLYEENS